MDTLLSALDFLKVKAALAAQAGAVKAALSGRLVGVDSAEAIVLEAAPGSPRVVTLRQLDPDRNGLKLVCWRQAANAARCFSLRGVAEVFDIVTGEVHSRALRS